MKNVKTLAIANLLGFILTIVLNILANALPINGVTTGELSDMYPNLFVPSGFTFAIWGLIYTLLLAFTIYQLVQAFSKNGNTDFIKTIGWLFLISCIANARWIVVWHNQVVWLSLVIMLVILSMLIGIYLLLDIGGKPVNKTEKWLVHIPFSVYLGWITVATIANVTTLAVDMNWSGFGISEMTWTIIMITIATLIGIIVLFRRKDWAYALVLIWAFYGIYAKRSAIDAELYQPIITTTIVGMIILGLLGVWSILKTRET